MALSAGLQSLPVRLDDPIQPGRRLLTAALTADGLTSQAATTFDYGTSLPDLVPGMPSLVPAERAAQVPTRTLTLIVSNQGPSAAAGTEVASFDSYANRRALEELRPQLEEAEANLRAASTGQRDEVIALARSEKDAAQAERDRLAADYERSQALWEQGLHSNAAYEMAEALHRQAEADLEAASKTAGGAKMYSTHEELLARRGFYHNLYMSQFKGHSQGRAALHLT